MSLYASVGAELTQYDMDTDAATLTRRGTVSLPANVQYVWPHASRRHLYVATSDSASGMGQSGSTHHVTAFRIDRVSGALSPHGAPIRLPTRPIHMATDIPSEYILVAFSNPAAIRVYRINADATPGEEVAQPGSIDPGIFAHQVRATTDNRQVILVTRGHDAADGKPEQPGALQVFDFRDGVLTNEVSVAPGGGYGFGPRHLDFHPTRPWVYVSLERQNQLDMFELKDGALSAAPRFRKDALADPGTRHRQLVGTVHVHPDGRTVYVANRSSETVEFGGQRVFAGGENSLAVYTIDQATGEPNLIQHVDTHGIHPRTFHIDPTGRLLVVAHIMGLHVRDGDTIRDVPTRLSLFRIASDGRLDFARAYDIEVGERTMWWMGMVDHAR
ncbi:MAG TPA: beta-propeller fold lactonase family protein [Acetobacteraceae bacterium]|jgi:6-phosphogluconolactonase|nr:beta-propeller fold lactonase family protein [Acetobacteraceae bacterium]